MQDIDDDDLPGGSIVIRGHSGERVVLIPLKRDSYGIKADAELSAAGLHGVKPELWLAIDTLGEFIAELTAFEERRSGMVTLRGMSWNEFSITFAVVDVTGSVEVRVVMRRYTWGSNRPLPNVIGLRFALRSSLPHILSQFQTLLTCNVPIDTGY